MIRNGYQRVRAGYDRVSDWSARHTAALFAVSYALLIVAVGLAVQSSHAVGVEARQRSAVDRARTAQLKWDKAADDHATCLRSAKGREESRHTFYVAFDTIARFSSDADRAEVRRFVAAEKRAIALALPSLDCETIAPPPKGPRPRIP